MYRVGEIFYFDNDYSNKAQFCNENNLRIVEIDPDGKGRRFQIQETPGPTKQELAQQEIYELEQWFTYYDTQVAQYQRCQRLGEEFDKDINELDAQAKTNAARIKELREILQAQK